MMTIREILADIHALQRQMLEFESRFGVRSDVFYAAYRSGEEPADDSWVRSEERRVGKECRL